MYTIRDILPNTTMYGIKVYVVMFVSIFFFQPTTTRNGSLSISEVVNKCTMGLCTYKF